MSNAKEHYDKFSERLNEWLADNAEDDIAELHTKWPREQSSITLDWGDIWRSHPDIAEDILSSPELMTGIFELAVEDYDIPSGENIEGVDVRFANLGETESMGVGEYRAEDVNSLLGVRGQVSKTTPVKPRTKTIAYECQRCGTVSKVPQPREKKREPNECVGCERQGPFTTVFEDSEIVNSQTVRLKQPPEEATGTGEGDYIDVYLEGDGVVTGSATGERAEVSGVLHTDIDESDTTLLDYYFDGHEVTPTDTDYDTLDVDDYREEFEALAAGEEGDIYDLLVGSVAPSLSGDDKLDDIKLTLALQLFGGWRRPYGDGTFARGDSHILLIGDPGVGKSTLLNAIESISPRSGFVSGKNATKAGVTAAAVRDEFGGTEWSLEAGVIVKSHKGVACMDEIDKVGGEVVGSLHTALEKQRLEVNKAGMDATLKCETALLAAGNPESGRFIPEISLSEQIDLAPALMSRFDLAFLLQDEPDEDRDEMIAEHSVNIRTEAGLVERGKKQSSDTNEPDIPIPVLRAHIAAARRECFPVIEDDEVHERIVGYYRDIRAESGDDAPSITPRKLDAIMRLAEASARVRLSDEVEMQDADRAIELLGRSLGDVGIDPDTGELTADIIEAGGTKTQNERKQLVKKTVAGMEDETDDGAPTEDVLDELEASGIERSKAEHEIQKLMRPGDLYEPRTGHLRAPGTQAD